MGRARAADRIDEPDLPRSPVVLLLVDFINPLDFPGGQALAPAARQAGQACAVLRSRAVAQGIQVVYANDNYGIWRSDFTGVWRRCRARGGVAAELAVRLKPRPGDCTILKPRHSAFHATPLALLLEQLRCKKLIVTGLAADSCVLFSAMDAYLRGYALWVPEDCTAAERENDKRQALEHMRRVLKAETRPACEPAS
jgi:nicotinamidase-related amidase